MLFKQHLFVYASVGLELEMIELEVSNMAYKLLFIYIIHMPHSLLISTLTFMIDLLKLHHLVKIYVLTSLYSNVGNYDYISWQSCKHSSIQTRMPINFVCYIGKNVYR